jgi:hypothetical protein
MTSQPSSDGEGRMVVMAWMVVMALPTLGLGKWQPYATGTKGRSRRNPHAFDSIYSSMKFITSQPDVAARPRIHA